jgi:cytochrome c oxidase subunit II
MEKAERRWLYVLIVVFVIVNAVTLSSLIPWQTWQIWQKPTPSQVVNVTYDNYVITMDTPVEIKTGEYVQFSATSSDVTYGFGVFRKDYSMVFQMQVLPGRTNLITWKFDESGMYDVRSTEYSGPKHSDMFVPDAIEVK